MIRSPETRRDLLVIAEFIARDSVTQAFAFLAAVERKVETLSMFPEAGRPRDEIRRGLRSYNIGKYLLLYERDEQVIRVIRIVHGARRLEDLFEA